MRNGIISKIVEQTEKKGKEGSRKKNKSTTSPASVLSPLVPKHPYHPSITVSADDTIGRRSVPTQTRKKSEENKINKGRVFLYT